MCGVVAIACLNDQLSYDSSNPRIRIFEQLIYGTALRGDDSTGIFVASDNNKITVAKRPIAAHEFLGGMAYRKFERKQGQFRYAAAHCRFATKGDVTYDNCHPFTNEHITMIHNGGVKNLHDFKHIDYDVDSNYVSHLLAEHDHVPEVLKQLDGDFALIWYNSNEKSFNFVRNDSRPLWMVTELNYVHLISEPELLYWVFKRNNFADIKLEDIKPVPANTWFKLTKPGAKEKAHVQRMEIEFKKPKHETVYYGGFGGADAGFFPHQNRRGGYHGSSSGASSATKSVENDKKTLELSTGLVVGETGRFYLTNFVPSTTTKDNGDFFGIAKSKGVESVTARMYWTKEALSLFSDEVEQILYDNASVNGGEMYVLQARVSNIFRNHEGLVAVFDSSTVTAEVHDGTDMWLYSYTDRLGTFTKRKSESKILHLPSSKPKEEKPDLLPPKSNVTDLVKGPAGVFISPTQFIGLTEQGCTRCNKPLPVEKADTVKWISVDHNYLPYCEMCEPFNATSEAIH